MKDIITKSYKESILAKEGFFKQNLQPIIQSAEVIADAFKADRKLLICGNGGSAADAQHIAAEFVNRFMIERPPLPALPFPQIHPSSPASEMTTALTRYFQNR